MAPQLNENRWITLSQVDPFTAWNKQAWYAAVRCVQAAGRGSMKGAISQLRHQCGECAQCAIGETRRGDTCENTVLLETQGPCGSARRCSDDTVTHDTSVQGKCHMMWCAAMTKMSHVISHERRLCERLVKTTLKTFRNLS